MSIFLAASIALTASVLGALPVSRWCVAQLVRTAPNVGGRTLSFIKTIADIGKGFIVVLALAMAFGHDAALFAAVGVFLGHTYPVFRGFSGGYGMGVLLGALVAFEPLIGLISLVGWTSGYYVFRFAGLAALTSALATPLVVAVYGLEKEGNILVFFAMSAFIFWRQREHFAKIVGRNEQVIAAEF